jgi:xylulokinase
VTGAAPEDVMTKPEVSEIIQPEADLVAAFDDGYTQYRKLYPAMKALQ